MSPKKRQKYATRSCLACRKRKVRCKLANVEVSSSLDPVAKEDACERCKKMGLDCIVWDGERKSKRYTVEDSSIQENKLKRQDTQSDRSISIDRDQILSPFYPFKPSFQPNHEEGKNETEYSDPVEEVTNHIGSRVKSHTFAEKVRLMGVLRRPILMMIQILERQDQFRCGIPSTIGEVEMSTTEKEKELDYSFLSQRSFDFLDVGLLAQHPHLPRLRDLLSLYKASPNSSRKLLLYTMLFLCRVGDRSPAGNMGIKHETTYHLKTISQLALQTVLHAPRSMEAAQALELLAVHAPFLLTSGEGNEQRKLSSKRESSTPGSVLIVIAIKILVSLGFEEGIVYQDPERKMQGILWTSLCSWELALSFHDHCPITPRQMKLNEYDNIWDSISTSQDDQEWRHVGEIARAIGYKALCFRSKALFESGKYELLHEKAFEEANDDGEMKSRQASILDAYSEFLKDEELDRCRSLSNIKADLQSNKILGQRIVPFAKVLISLCNFVWLWLDLEVMGMHYIMLSKALGSMHAFVLRNKHEDFIPVGQPGEASNSVYRIEFRQRIWEHPEWSEHVGLYGKLRNKVILSCISRSCQIKRYLEEMRSELEQASASEEEENVSCECRLFVPMPLWGAFLVNATKSLLDTQIVILQAWNKVHEDTDTYLVIIRQAAEVLGDDELDFRIIDPMTGKQEPGIGKCCADILRIIADTMFDWQERQRIVILNHRDKQRIKRKAQSDVGRHTTSSLNTHTNTGSSIVQDTVPHLLEPTPEANDISIDCNMGTQVSMSTVWDQMPMLNTLFDGMINVPDWNEFIASINQHQASFPLGG